MGTAMPDSSPVYFPPILVTQLRVAEFITGEASVPMDTVASFGTYFNQEEHRSKEQFLGVTISHLQRTFPSGDPVTICRDLTIGGHPKVGERVLPLSLKI